MDTTAAPPRAGFTSPDVPSDNILQTCVHCGLCLPNCPTYRERYVEPSSPRGRIHLIRQVAEGRIGLDSPVFREQMYQCLDCRACEAVCPSGVQYGQLVEAARAQIERATPRPWSQRLLRRVVFGGLFASMPRFRLFAGLLRLYQRTGLQRLARATGLLRVAGLAERERMLPAIDRQFLVPKGQTWMPTGTAQRRVALFAGCVMSTAYAEIDRATARVLAANGCEVVAPPGQGCCGALHVHAGLLDDGRALMRRNVEAFERLDVEAIVVNAAGCGAALKEYGHLLADDPAYAERAAAMAAKVKDVTEYLAALDLVPPPGRLDLRVTYQEPCHLVHAQGIKTQPRQLLRAIPGVQLVEMAESDLCCGSAGIYNLTNPGLSGDLRRRKLANALDMTPEVIVSANPGCMLQLQAGLAEIGSPIRVRHLVELLDEAYRTPPAPLPSEASGEPA
ncbi:MAG TPA: heterodisulfide reductase-related iron-sulfur binding cluster [Chloroflexota bacterium]|nr:heterodisulfide reductase-related iron-sulfur binding cluster [Chloroflexota bacterium]